MKTNSGNKDLKAATEHIMSVMQTHKEELLSKPHVVGVAIGFRYKDGDPTQTLAMVVMVDQKIPADSLSEEQQIPEMIEGVPIDVQEVGEISAY
jgi:hypothetical protein